jgi:DNA-binding PadR family transcriptional regulator
MTVPMALLALLDEGPTHGFDLKRRYDALLGQERELKYGQVYSTLARLERDGLTAGVGIEAGAGADRKVYAITPAGVGELDTWLASPQPASGRPSELFARVVLALASGRPAEQVLDAHRRTYLDRVRRLTAARRDGDVIDRLAGDYEAAHLQADLDWIELASARLADVTAHVRAVAGRPGDDGEREAGR